MCWQTKEIFQIILELASIKIQMGHSNYFNHTWWRNNQPFRDYSVWIGPAQYVPFALILWYVEKTIYLS